MARHLRWQQQQIASSTRYNFLASHFCALSNNNNNEMRREASKRWEMGFRDPPPAIKAHRQRIKFTTLDFWC